MKIFIILSVQPGPDLEHGGLGLAVADGAVEHEVNHLLQIHHLHVDALVIIELALSETQVHCPVHVYDFIGVCARWIERPQILKP